MRKIFNFSDFIKESVDSNGRNKYSFSFPVTKKYELSDDGSWTWDEMCKYLLEINGMDLKSDVESYLGLEDNEEREISDDDFDKFISNYNMRYRNAGKGGKMSSGGWPEFKKDYGLDYEEKNLEREDYQGMMMDFNEMNLEKYFDINEYDGNPFDVYNIRLIEPVDRRGYYGSAQGTFETNIELDENQISFIKEYISGQCSDGWGEGFEQQKEKESSHGLNFETSLHPYSSDNWNVVIKKI